MRAVSCAIVVAPLQSLPSPNLVDITQYLRNLGTTSVDQRLRVLGFVDYQALVARVLCGETATQDTKDEKQPVSKIVVGLPTPPSIPFTPLPSSQPLPVPVPSEPGNEGITEHLSQEFIADGISDPPPPSAPSTPLASFRSLPLPTPSESGGEGTTVHETEQGHYSHNEFKPEGIGDVPQPQPQPQQQRSVSLDALMVTLPTMSEEEIRSGRSTSGLRRRPRLRPSVFEIFRPDNICSLDFREKATTKACV